jgi:hypothetical protein
MNIYSFLLPGGFRKDVKASYPRAGYNKLRKQGLTPARIYQQYGKDGSADVYDWRTLQNTKTGE